MRYFQFVGGDFIGETPSPELMKKYMTEAEWNKIYDMSRDKDLFKNLMDSLFPTVYGHDQVKKGIFSFYYSILYFNDFFFFF